MNLVSTRHVRLSGLCYAAIALLVVNWVQPSRVAYKIDPNRSAIEIDVYRGGLLKAFGHDHRIDAPRISGTVQFAPEDMAGSSVSLAIASDSLTVVDPDASEKERSDVQTTMESAKVLDTQTFHTIAFNSTRVSRATKEEDGLDIRISGRLSLHGIEKEITIPVRISFAGTSLRATGTCSVVQSDFNIVPIKLGGGTVRVKDPVRVTFNILAVREN